MRTKTIGMTMSILVILGLLILGCAKPAPTPTPTPAPKPSPAPAPKPAPAIVLRYMDYSPPKGTRYEAEAWLFGEIEKRSGSRVKIEQYWASAIKMVETLPAVREGTADMVFIVPAWFPTQLSLLTWATVIPLAPGTAREIGKACQAVYNQVPAINAQVESWNMRAIVAGNILDTYDLFTRRPVRTMADWKGWKVRVSDRQQGTFAGMLGLTPVFMETQTVPDALAQGLLEGGLYAPYIITAYGMEQYIRSWTPIGIITGGIAACLFMNLDTWKRLPADIQKIISDVSREYLDYYADLNDKEAQTVMAKLSAAGVKKVDLPPAEMAQLRDRLRTDPATKAMESEWLAANEKQGLPGKLVLDKGKELLGIK